MWVIVLEDSEKPNCKMRCKGPFETKEEAVNKHKEYFLNDMVCVSAVVVEVTEP